MIRHDYSLYCRSLTDVIWVEFISRALVHASTEQIELMAHGCQCVAPSCWGRCACCASREPLRHSVKSVRVHGTEIAQVGVQQVVVGMRHVQVECQQFIWIDRGHVRTHAPASKWIQSVAPTRQRHTLAWASHGTLDFSPHHQVYSMTLTRRGQVKMSYRVDYVPRSIQIVLDKLISFVWWPAKAYILFAMTHAPWLRKKIINFLRWL